MSRRNESLGYTLVHDCPWWVSIIVGLVVYAVMNCAPMIPTENQILKPILGALPGVAWMALMGFVGLSLLSFWRQFVMNIVSKRRARTDAVEESACPACGGPMVMRTAKKGANAGSQFWGCKAFPLCKGARS
jgi:Topoisomerase DNA binding C4 zinc finger